MKQAAERLRVIKLILLGQLLAMAIVGMVGLLAGSLLGQSAEPTIGQISSGQVTGLSALLGGLIAWLPNTYFAIRAFRYRGARAAQKIVRSFYAGAFGKMILTMAMFAIVFIKVKPLSALALFLGFAVVQAMNWIVPLMVALQERRRYSRED